ncbi:MAG: hypothetical protein ACFCAD_23550 [Pleurocapsa sp.]
MLAKDIPAKKQSIKQKDSQAIIYETALFILLEARHKLQKMVKNGEITLTMAELNKSLSVNMQKLSSNLEKQIAAADLWQVEDRCPRCKLKLIPLVETCICGCETPKRSDFLDSSNLQFLIPENCTD